MVGAEPSGDNEPSKVSVKNLRKMFDSEASASTSTNVTTASTTTILANATAAMRAASATVAAPAVSVPAVAAPVVTDSSTIKPKAVFAPKLKNKAVFKAVYLPSNKPNEVKRAASLVSKGTSLKLQTRATTNALQKAHSKPTQPPDVSMESDNESVQTTGWTFSQKHAEIMAVVGPESKIKRVGHWCIYYTDDVNRVTAGNPYGREGIMVRLPDEHEQNKQSGPRRQELRRDEFRGRDSDVRDEPSSSRSVENSGHKHSLRSSDVKKGDKPKSSWLKSKLFRSKSSKKSKISQPTLLASNDGISEISTRDEHQTKHLETQISSKRCVKYEHGNDPPVCGAQMNQVPTRKGGVSDKVVAKKIDKPRWMELLDDNEQSPETSKSRRKMRARSRSRTRGAKILTTKATDPPDVSPQSASSSSRGSDRPVEPKVLFGANDHIDYLVEASLKARHETGNGCDPPDSAAMQHILEQKASGLWYPQDDSFASLPLPPEKAASKKQSRGWLRLNKSSKTTFRDIPKPSSEVSKNVNKHQAKKAVSYSKVANASKRQEENVATKHVENYDRRRLSADPPDGDFQPQQPELVPPSSTARARARTDNQAQASVVNTKQFYSKMNDPQPVHSHRKMVVAKKDITYDELNNTTISDQSELRLWMSDPPGIAEVVRDGYRTRADVYTLSYDDSCDQKSPAYDMSPQAKPDPPLYTKEPMGQNEVYGPQSPTDVTALLPCTSNPSRNSRYRW